MNQKHDMDMIHVHLMLGHVNMDLYNKQMKELFHTINDDLLG